MRAAPAPRRGAVIAAWVATALLMAAFAGDYRLSVLVGAGVLAVAAVGVDLSVGSAGMLVFSAPAFMLVGALASAWVGLRTDLPGTAATVVGVVGGLAIGLVLAVLVGRTLRRVTGVGVALLTLFVLHLVRGVVRQQESLGGSLGLAGVPPLQLGPFRADTLGRQAVVVLVCLAVVLAALTRFVRSGPGLELRAARGDQPAAAACGVSAERRRFEAFVLGSLCATLAGSLYAHTLGYISADTAGLAVLMDLLLMVFVGGAGSVWGALVGALLVRMIPELYPGPERFDVLARGAVFLLILTLAPGGLAAAAESIRTRTRRPRGSRSGVPQFRGLEPRNASCRPGPPRADEPRPGCVLEAEGVARSFGGVRALEWIDLSIDAGEVCAVIGPNGAGKTTLFNVLAGTVEPERGRIRLAGVDITGLPPERRARLGMARTFQEVRLFPGLTVLEHVLVGTRVANDLGVGARLARPADGSPEARAAARDALRITGLADVADTPAERLPFGLQRRVELARALAGRPQVLLLDEPGSGLSATERSELAAVIRQLGAGRCAVVLVDHNLDFVFDLARRVVVLDRGSLVFDGPVEAAFDDAAVAAAYPSHVRRAGR